MNDGSDCRKTVRGARRKCNAMITSINELTEVFPSADGKSGYWHMHLPVGRNFIDSKRAPSYVRKNCMQALINRVEHLMDIKADSQVRTRVAACITLPRMWDSQIIVFFDETYYKRFFNRTCEEQKWFPLPPQRNLLKEYGLSVPEGMSVRGFKEVYTENGKVIESELWFFGEL